MKNKTDNIKNWYVSNYPTDNLGLEINEKANFTDALKVLDEKGLDIYDYIEVSDSLVRERIFEQLAKINNCDYNTIYNKWLNS